MATPAQPIKHILPRHVEIMRRLVLGEKQRDIARSLEMTESRLSIIVNSPLFQLELRKMQRRQEDRVAAIHEKIIVGAEKAVDLHNQIIDGAVTMTDPEDGHELKVYVPLAARQTSGTAIANLFLRLHRGGALDPAEEDGQEGYESRLEREVTFKETETVRRRGGKTALPSAVDDTLNATHPTLSDLDDADDEALDVMVEAAVSL